MKKVMITCDRCGRHFDIFDEQEGFGFHYNVGYGSRHDGETVDIDLCCACFDEIIDEIEEKKKAWTRS